MRKCLFILLALLAFTAPALAQSTSPVILQSGCGTGSFPLGTGYLTLDPIGNLAAPSRRPRRPILSSISPACIDA